MRALLGAVAAVCVLAGAAYAQQADQPLDAPTAEMIAAAPASRCPAFPAEPDLPQQNGRANQREMTAANGRYQAWGEQMMAVFNCRSDEARELRAQALALQAQRMARVNEHGAGVETLLGVCRRWVTETNAYSERNGMDVTPEQQDVDSWCRRAIR